MDGASTIACAIIRGGTSKGLYLHGPELPSDPRDRDRVLLALFGSPDRRQIDGLGGADPLTSKCAIVSASDDPDYDLDYLFAQVEIERPFIDYKSVCGNISSGLGHFALLRGLSRPTGDILHSRVRVLNAPGAWLEVQTPVADGRPRSDGDFAIPGVPGTGAEVVLNLAGLAGAQLGAVLPTGRAAETLEVPGMPAIRVTLIDVGNPHVYVTAESVGLTGTESAARLDSDRELLDRLERIRSAAAHRLGLVDDPARATADSPALPILGIVAPPADYTTPTGETVAAGDFDLLGRLMFMQRTHKAFAATSTACTGAAARIPGTLANEVARPVGRGQDPGSVRIGHPAGVVTTESVVETGGAGTPHVRRATLSRTARILMDGRAYLPRLTQVR